MTFKISKIVFLLVIIGLFIWVVIRRFGPQGPDDGDILSVSTELDTNQMPLKKTFFSDTFQSSGFEESGNMDESVSSDWWLNSGGMFNVSSGIGSTVQGELPYYNRWKIAYSISNPVDTDKGFHPQNIFRLVTKTKWKNFDQQVYFKIKKDNLSKSPNRNESNGLLLFNRYYSGQTLYYVGIRVDGAIVIKKKLNGKYYTMAYEKYFPGNYNKESSPNLLPKNVWIGIKSTVTNLPENVVSIKLYIDSGKNNSWTFVTEAKDIVNKYGDALILEEGYAGIRTDFMDVEFSDYQIKELE